MLAQAMNHTVVTAEKDAMQLQCRAHMLSWLSPYWLVQSFFWHSLAAESTHELCKVNEHNRPPHRKNKTEAVRASQTFIVGKQAMTTTSH